jgi:hypothetical protein
MFPVMRIFKAFTSDDDGSASWKPKPSVKPIVCFVTFRLMQPCWRRRSHARGFVWCGRVQVQTDQRYLSKKPPQQPQQEIPRRRPMAILTLRIASPAFRLGIGGDLV